jgi:pilus assembly protein TadC
VRQRADEGKVASVGFGIMANSRQSPNSSSEKELEVLLDKVSNTREELLSVERALERLRDTIAEIKKRKK